MKVKKRKKSKGKRGSGTHGRGARKKARGKGHRGGKGWSGTGKRADQKKTYVLKYKYPYFGRKKRKKKKVKKINVGDIEKNLESFKKKYGNKIKNKPVIHFKGHKILGGGKVGSKLKIKAKSFSKTAKKKIEKAGGEAITEKEESEKNGA
jgi:large subunit ribosomal protein L15